MLCSKFSSGIKFCCLVRFLLFLLHDQESQIIFICSVNLILNDGQESALFKTLTSV